MTISPFHVIKDPVHGTLQFTDQEDAWIKPFINHPVFQRLRHIKQLGLGDMLFPGAVHTRFNHCLGCCYVASQIAKKLDLAAKDIQLVMIAGLLHDIGHGPFSHAFEDLFPGKLIRHEDWTPYFLSEFKHDDFIAQYNQCNPDFPLDSAFFTTLEAMIMHQPSDNPLLADIVSSQLDADRLDYLLRDSHFCGVTYGQYDVRWLLHCLTAVETSQGLRLGVNYKGIGVVEHYLNARRLMMRNIYHHYKKYAVEYLLTQLLIGFAKAAKHEFNALTNTVLGQYLINVQAFNQQPGDKQTFIAENYALYKQLCDYDIYLLIRNLLDCGITHDVVDIAERVYHRHLPKVFPLSVAEYERVKAELPVIYGDKIKPWQLSLLKMPHQSYVGDKDPILVQYAECTKPLDQVSLMIGALSDKYEHSCFLCVDRAIAEDNGVKQLISALRQ